MEPTTNESSSYEQDQNGSPTVIRIIGVRYGIGVKELSQALGSVGWELLREVFFDGQHFILTFTADERVDAVVSEALKQPGFLTRWPSILM